MKRNALFQRLSNISLSLMLISALVLGLMGSQVGGVFAQEEEPTPEVTIEPGQEPTEEPTLEPPQDSTEEPTLEPPQDPTEEPTLEPPQDPTEEPVQEPTEEPLEEPTEQPTAEPGVEDDISLQIDPWNDTYDVAYNITSTKQSFTQTNIASMTSSSDDPLICSFDGINRKHYHTVWFKFTPASSGNLELSTQDSNYDTVLAVLTRSSGSWVTRACNDEAYYANNNSRVTLSLTAGTTYYIEVADYYSGVSNKTLNLHFNFNATTLNDFVDKAQPIITMPITWTQNINYATSSYDDPLITTSKFFRSVWYKYTPTASGTLNLDTSGSDFDTILAVWVRESQWSDLTLVDSNDDFGGTTQSALSINVTSGGIYYIEVVNYYNTDGVLKLNVSFTSNAKQKIFYSKPTFDGWVLESSETSSKGGSLNATETTFRVGDDKSDRQYRGILHFDTSSLPDGATITQAVLFVKRSSTVGTTPFNTHGNLYVDIKKGAFSNSIKLQVGDWQASASKLAVGSIPNVSTDNWYSINLPATAYPYISKTGATQFRLRFSKGDNDDRGADYIKFFSGNTGTQYNRPTLVIKYN